MAKKSCENYECGECDACKEFEALEARMEAWEPFDYTVKEAEQMEAQAFAESKRIRALEAENAALKAELQASREAHKVSLNHFYDMEKERDEWKAKYEKLDDETSGIQTAYFMRHSSDESTFEQFCNMLMVLPDQNQRQWVRLTRESDNLKTELDALRNRHLVTQAERALLLNFYRFMFEIDATSNAIEALLDEKEYEAWAELSEIVAKLHALFQPK